MSSGSDLDIIDPTFKKDLEKSADVEWLVGRWLWWSGNYVMFPPKRFRDKVENRMEFSDNGDLFIIRPGNKEWERIEAKGREIQFTCEDDFPFSTIIVDVRHQWDNAKKKALMYVIVSKDRKHCAVIYGNTSDYWKMTERYDSHANRDRKYYECKKSACVFFNMEEEKWSREKLSKSSQLLESPASAEEELKSQATLQAPPGFVRDVEGDFFSQ